MKGDVAVPKTCTSCELLIQGCGDVNWAHMQWGYIDGATSSNIFEATGETCDDVKTALDTAVEAAEAIFSEKLGSTKVCQYVYEGTAIGDWIKVFVEAAGCCGEGVSVCGADGKGKGP